MSTVNDTDILAVERDGIKYQVPFSDMSTLNDTDLFSIERDGVKYKVEAQYISTGASGAFDAPVEVLTPLNGAGLGPGLPYNPISSPIVTVGAGGSVDFETNEITAVNSVSTSFIAIGTSSNSFGSGAIEEGISDRKTNSEGGVLTVTLSPVQSGDFIVYSTGNAESDRYTVVFEYEGGSTETVWDATAPRTGPGNTCQFAIGQKSGVVGFTIENTTANDTNLCGVTVDSTKLVSGEDAGTELTFTGDVSDNPALKYFAPGDFLGISGATDVICGGKACQTEINIGAQGGIAITTSSSSITRIVVDCEGAADKPTSKLTLSSTLLTSNLDANTDCTIIQASDSIGNAAVLGNGQRETVIFSFAGTTGTWYLSAKRVKIYNVYTDQEGGASVSKDVNVVSTGYPDSNTMTASGNIFSDGDTLSKTSTYEASLTCTDSSELSNMVGPISMTDENGDLVTPQTSEIIGIDTFVTSDFVSSDVAPNGFDGTTSLANMVDGSGGTSAAWTYTTAATITCTNMPSGTEWVIAQSGVADPSQVECNWSDGSTTPGGVQTFVDPVTLQSIVMTGIGSSSSKSCGISRIKCNGFTIATGKSLTFADSTDLEYFSPGDIIGSQIGPAPATAWSSHTTNNGRSDLPPANAFDGSTSTFCASAGGGEIVFTTPSGITLSGQLEVYGNNGGGPAANQLTVASDENNVSAVGLPQGSWYDAGQQTNITSITVNSTDGGGGATLYAIKLDGVILTDNDGSGESLTDVTVINNGYDLDPKQNTLTVDGGEWDSSNQSEVWSSTEFCTQGAEGDGGYSSDRAFSGELIGEQVWYPPEGGEAKFITGDRFDSATKLEFSYSRLGGGPTLKVNNNTLNLAEGIGVKHSMDLPNGFQSLTFNYAGAGNYYGIQWIKIDGRLLIDKGVDPDTGENKVTGSTLQASATDVIGVDGNTLHINGVAGTWLEGLHVKGNEISSSGPSPNSIVFTSSNGGTTAVTGTDASLAKRVWTLESGSSAVGPWTLVGAYEDFDASASQDGAVPWSTGKPALEAETYYRVKVRYDSTNAEPIESTFNTFQTGYPS